MSTAATPPEQPVRVVHLTPAVSRMGGGVWSFVRDLATAQRSSRVATPTVVGVRDAFTDADAAAPLARNEVPLRVARRVGPRAIHYAPALAAVLTDALDHADVLHLHGGLRMWPNVTATHVARRLKRPVLLSTHGMLYPWLLRRHRLRKRLIARLWDDRVLHAATAIHVTCEQEAGFARDFGLTQPLVVIPAGVDVKPLIGVAARVLHAHPHLRGRRLATFLGILDRKKGLIRLMHAWASVRPNDDWHLVIAGPDQDGHAAEVRDAARTLNVDVTLLGPVWDDGKHDLLAASDLFVLPSDWENFGLAVGEALAAGVPVLTTTNTPWDWLPREHAGWWVDPTASAVATALADATARDAATLRAMGAAGRAVVTRDYRWPTVVERFSAAYHDLQK